MLKSRNMQEKQVQNDSKNKTIFYSSIHIFCDFKWTFLSICQQSKSNYPLFCEPICTLNKSNKQTREREIKMIKGRAI